MAEQGVTVDVHNEKLSVRLTDEAKLLMGRQLADANRELVQMADDRKALQASLSAKEKAQVARIAELSTNLALGLEHRDVEVYGSVDFANGLVRYRRRDTGEEVRTRAIRDEERQTAIPGVERAFRAACGHVTADPEDGTIPSKCKTCEGAEDVPPRKLEVVDYKDDPPGSGGEGGDDGGEPDEE